MIMNKIDDVCSQYLRRVMIREACAFHLQFMGCKAGYLALHCTLEVGG